MSLPKKKLLIILGAGSSIPCGMPSVAAIDIKMKEWCHEWLQTAPHLPIGAGSGVFNDLWSILENYYRMHSRQHLGIHVNFERVLGEMIALASWVTPSPFGNALYKAVEDGQLSSHFSWSSPPPDKPFFYRTLILDQLAHHLGKLAQYMRLHSKALNKAGWEYECYQNILSQLRDEFEVGIYNLNYDNVALSAWPGAFTGFYDGIFNAREVSLRKQWGFIYHLHGSVHYTFTDPPFANALKWKDDLGGTFDDSQPLKPNMAGGFVPTIPTTLIAGGFKLDQLLSDPFQTFYASLVRHAHEADAILIAGYGFGDVHVNRTIQNRYLLFPYDTSRRPPALVITKSIPPYQPTAQRQTYDLWGYELTHTLNSRFHQQPSIPNSCLSIEQLIAQNMLEEDMHGHVRIWHGGFLESLGCIEQIIKHLNPGN